MLFVVRVVLVGLISLAGYLAYETASVVDVGGLSNESTVVVEVLNGCGRRGVGERATEILSDKGFDVMFVGNADDYGYEETLLVDRSGDPSKAVAIGEALGAGMVVHQVNASSYVEVTVILGKDFAASLASRRGRDAF
ncbi:MAG: LytR C-terminal domain-containing protein [bacterium]